MPTTGVTLFVAPAVSGIPLVGAGLPLLSAADCPPVRCMRETATRQALPIAYVSSARPILAAMLALASTLAVDGSSEQGSRSVEDADVFLCVM